MGPQTRARQVAQLLLRVGAVSLRPEQPFRYASGLLSPIYCDNRILISFPHEREQVTRWFGEVIRENEIAAEVVAGTATAGIPHAAWLAATLDLPMVYVRAGGKEHGKGRRVEGLLEAGRRVLVVEDLVTTGGSVLDTVAALRQEGAVVEHVLAIFSYGLARTEETFAQVQVSLHPLTTLPVLLEVATAEGYISPAERAMTVEWATDPVAWSRAREGET